MSDTVRAYDQQAASLAALYEALAPQSVHAELADFVPRQPGLFALDVGAGSGRDAAWLVSLGYEVVAVEPAAGMRAEAIRRHPDKRIRWLDDRLPDLAEVHRRGIAFDLILLSAVWMHVQPPARMRAFRKLVTLLKPGGVVLISLRDGPAPPDRPMWPAPPGEIEALARSHGLAVLRNVAMADRQGREDVRWTGMVLRLPDDGAGALPLLRGIILNDEKSATYKLGLLRAVARIADGTPALAMERIDEDVVDVPLGLVAMNWIRMYLPLVSSRLPQRPDNAGPDGLGFAGEGFRSLLEARVPGQDLRIGARFSGDRAAAVARALSEARSLISNMPAHYTRFPNSGMQVFEARPATAPRAKRELTLDADLLGRYGSLAVPGHVWRTLQRLGSWVEPVLVSEWARLVRFYGERMGRVIGAGEVEAALAWLDPARDTELARRAARQLLAQGRALHCVWSGSRLVGTALDIDHCLPWSAWPCGDLWNLLPAKEEVNRRQKRDRLPSAAALASAREQIVEWWEMAWRSDEALAVRFARECAAALPVQSGATSEDVFAALEWRRLRLRQDQQVEEWPGGG